MNGGSPLVAGCAPFAGPHEPEHSFGIRAGIVAVAIIGGVLAAFGEWAYVAALIGLLCVVRWPVQVTFGAYAFLIPFDNVSSVGPESSGATLTRYMSFALILVLLSVGFTSKRLSVPPRAALWWSLFVFWGALTFGWAVDPQAVLERIPTVLSLLSVYIVASSFRFTSKELTPVLVMAVLGGCAAAIMLIYSTSSGTSFHDTGRASLMMTGRETDPNSLSASLLLPLSLCIGAFVHRRSRLEQAGALAGIAIVGLAQLLTMSRGGILAILTMIFVYVYHLRVKRHILVATVCLIALSMFMPHSFFERLTFSDKGAARLDIWTASLGLFPHYGIFGAGLNNFAIAYYSVAGSAPAFQGLNRASHSIYLGMSVELGIVGLTLLLLACREQLRGEYIPSLLPYRAACWGLLAAGLTLDIVFKKYFWLCWILIAILTVKSKASCEASNRASERF